MSVSARLVSACQIRAFNYKGHVLKLPFALTARQEFNRDLGIVNKLALP